MPFSFGGYLLILVATIVWAKLLLSLALNALEDIIN